MAYAVVGTTVLENQTTGAGTTVAITRTVTAGNTGFLVVKGGDDNRTISSVNDGTQNWGIANAKATTPDTSAAALYSFSQDNLVGGSTTLTVTFSTTESNITLVFMELSGLLATGSLDQTAEANTSGGVQTLAVGPTGTLGQSGEAAILVGYGNVSGRDFNAIGGWTRDNDLTGSSYGVSVWDQRQTTTAAVSATLDTSPNNQFMIGFLATFKEAAAGSSADVLVRYGNVAQTQGSGLLTAPFASTAVATLGGGAYYLRRRRLEESVTWDDL